MQQNNRLFVTDLDGTLLRSDAALSPYTMEVLNKLLDKGECITFCTARSFQTASRLLKGINLRLPCVVFNGAFIIDPIKGAPLVSNLLNKQIALSLIESGSERGLTPFVFGFDGDREVLLHANPHNQGQQLFLKHRRGDKRLRKVSDIHVLDENITLNFIGTYQELYSFKEWVGLHFSNLLKVQFMEDTYLPGYYTLEFYHPCAEKGLMLGKLADLCGKSLHHTTVFGDNLNDLDMFLVAGHKVAVANAHPDLKMCATEMIGSNDEDGVARYLEQFL